MNKKTQTSQATGNTSNSYFNANIPQLSEARSSEEKDIVMRKCRRKSNVEIINEELKGSSSREGYIRIHKCRRISRVDNINEEVKGWTSSSKKHEASPEPTNTKDDICLE